jgi:hypothetical protein
MPQKSTSPAIFIEKMLDVELPPVPEISSQVPLVLADALALSLHESGCRNSPVET